jgi:molybdopterin synthase catalytic subunit
MVTDIAIQTEPITNLPAHRANAGAMVRFEGRVRETEDGKKIRALLYEAYQPMAENQMKKILEELAKRHPCLCATVRHRIGEVPAGEVAILIETLAAHRAEAFALTSLFMDRLKQDVPIWKMRALPLES